MSFKLAAPLTTPALLQIPQTGKEYAVETKSFPNGEQIFINFRTFLGSENNVNGVIAVENTGVVETWYRPDITSDCRLIIGGKPYEIIGEPENINMRNQYLKIRVRLYTGGA